MSLSELSLRVKLLNIDYRAVKIHQTRKYLLSTTEMRLYYVVELRWETLTKDHNKVKILKKRSVIRGGDTNASHEGFLSPWFVSKSGGSEDYVLGSYFPRVSEGVYI